MSKVIVYHTSYGCDTGCCGHVVEVDGEIIGDFDFGHPNHYGLPEADRDAAYRKYAEDLVRSELGDEHVADLDWENCTVIDD